MTLEVDRPVGSVIAPAVSDITVSPPALVVVRTIGVPDVPDT